MKQVTIGLSGHIDHGKTSIVESLTGKNTDSLKEEINRGMTIDIGFAHLNKNISLIDVPGHEKFIRNMVAGVCSIDYPLLVIAADDGLMPQTIEHFQILNMLGLDTGIIVINKIDLVDSEWLELIELEIIDFVKDTFLSNAKIIKVSTVTQEGVNKLKEEILNLSNSNVNKFERGVFRMFVDRVFTKKGFGTVVTGTVLSGLVNKGQEIEILPISQNSNIRGIHSHDKSVDNLSIGNRGAINLQSIDRYKIKRGFHIGEKEYFSLVGNVAVKVKILNQLKHNQRIRFHLGTQEVMARILFINQFNENYLLAFIKFEDKIIASFKDKFIIRTYSPITTIGGGEVLDINIPGKWNKIKEYLNQFDEYISDVDVIKNIIGRNPLYIFKNNDLSQHLGINSDKLNHFIGKISDIVVYGTNNFWILTKKQNVYIENLIISIINQFHLKNSIIKGMLIEQINDKLLIEDKLLKYILLNLYKDKKIKIENDYYSIYDFTIKLSQNDIIIKKKLLDILERESYETSSLNDLVDLLKENEVKIKKILKIAGDDIIVINGNIFFTKNNYNKLLKDLDKHFAINNTLSIGDFKKITNASRKYVVPLLEYLDKNKITYREGNIRKYAKK